MSIREDPFHELRRVASRPAAPKPDERSLAYWWPRLVKRDGSRCFYCWKPLDPPGTIDPGHDDAPSIEHVLAQTKGGTWRKDNLVLACNYCNCLVRNFSIAWKVQYRDEALAKRLAEKMRGAA